MTEAQWLACEAPAEMLQFLLPVTSQRPQPRKVSDRKVRLFTCACCRRICHLLSEDGERAMEITELYADKRKKNRQREAAYRAIAGVHTTIGFTDAQVDAREAVLGASIGARHRHSWHRVPERVVDAVSHRGREPIRQALEVAEQVKLLRDIFGNPFRPVAFAPEWRTDTALAIAALMYESRDFSAMPILADALQDVGCDRADMLEHCRDPHATHVRGCWVVDAVLDKA